MAELKVPTLLDFANVEPFREELFEHMLDERDMLFEALHTMVLRFGHRVRTQTELVAMDKAKAALDRINSEWRHHEYPSS